jgi:hypothetical protein
MPRAMLAVLGIAWTNANLGVERNNAIAMNEIILLSDNFIIIRYIDNIVMIEYTIPIAVKVNIVCHPVIFVRTEFIMLNRGRE